MTDSDPLDLDNLRAYARAALERAAGTSDGPWEVGISPNSGRPIITNKWDGRIAGIYGISSQRPEMQSNAAFIAAARLDVPNLAASVLTLAAELEQARAENAAHVLDVARLAEALDPLQAIVAYGSVNNDPRLWTEVRD